MSALADVASTSNATELNPDPYGLATMDLTDEDYGISVASSLGSVTNTISPSGVEAFIYYNDASSGVDDVLKRSDVSLESGRLSFSFVLDSGDEITKFGYSLYSNSLPSPGGYTFSFDFASDFSIDYSSIGYTVFKSRSNAGTQVSSGSLRNIDWYSGDVYCSSTEINLTNISKVNIIFYPTAPIGNAVGGDAAFSFLVADTSDSALDWLGSDTSSADYQSDVSSSLSDISSSIGDMSESLDSAAESLEYISTSQNLIIQGIDNVIMHISDQLYAFWDQLYNLIHEPTYARLGEILDAIRNLDLEITVELDEVTNAISTMNSQLQEKFQTTTDQITGGYDNSVMESESSKLDSSLTEYEEAEQTVIDSVNESLNDFEFDAELDDYKNIITVISDFLQALYDSSGGLKVVINLSMLLSLAGIVIGIYRFGGGD